MKHFSTPKKALSVVLSLIFLLVFFASFCCICEAVDAGCYDNRRDVCIAETYKAPLYDNLRQVVQSYLYNDGDLKPIAEIYQNTNFEFELYENGTCLYSTRTYRDVLQTNDYYISYETETAPSVRLVGYAVQPINCLDIFTGDIRFIIFLYSMRYVFIALIIAAALLFIPFFVYLLVSAGKHPNEEKARGSFVELIPFDLFTAIYVGLFILAAFGYIMIMGDLFQYLGRISYILFTLLSGLCYLLVLLYLMSFITRLRIGGILKTTLIWRIFAFIFRTIGRFFRFIGRKLRAFFGMLPLVWQMVVALGVLFLADILAFLFYLATHAGFLYVIYLTGRTILFAMLAIYALYMLRKLQKGGEAIAKGDFSYQIETENMLGDFKRFGDDLNHIGTSMEKEVASRIKSERMKTELITNVSHDIKTPLTSIINYVDLIKKEEPENENVREYVEVLDRQAHKLKKLIGDLVEASKASTGNIAVELAECDVSVMLEQTVGEYEDKLQDAGLSAVVTSAQTPMKIMADGRHLWRVFDNLMNNICKYSLPGTRVYLETKNVGETGVITFKNISKAPIDVPAEELTERFVRADSSRNTEGSGLGLSIAQSLVKLQNGSLDIVCDGDLFKVVLTFPLL